MSDLVSLKSTELTNRIYVCAEIFYVDLCLPVKSRPIQHLVCAEKLTMFIWSGWILTSQDGFYLNAPSQILIGGYEYIKSVYTNFP